jgi:hypothetical protein
MHAHNASTRNAHKVDIIKADTARMQHLGLNLQCSATETMVKMIEVSEGKMQAGLRQIKEKLADNFPCKRTPGVSNTEQITVCAYLTDVEGNYDYFERYQMPSSARHMRVYARVSNFQHDESYYVHPQIRYRAETSGK